ncbi:hypothetical protein [Actinomycetospora cinnamomea]|uniref:Uncharacterized protein n=1 Tax=Actinomycetospora cinnamomea TaxID=663609 RepID=A0A2U1F755_9PSEU|nr:hypothetical protein [Actinomycetospora cinnamomea]PVZ08011.1 hypothetical protein C8D89_110165 [Actinomycetospora cinnamomea]
MSAPATGARGLRARLGRGRAGASGPAEDVRPRSYRDATLMINRSREDYLALGIIVLAIGGDIAAFYVVLARVFRGSPFLIVLGTVGFAAAAVGLAHLVGQGLARRRCGDPRASTTLTVLAAATWLVLGVAAFVSRLLTPSGSSSGGGFGSGGGGFGSGGGGFGSGGGGFGGSSSGIELSAALPAALFGALFLASGMAAMVATFVSFNPVAGALRRAERRMHEATERERASRAELERAREALRQQENEREREEQRWRAARQQVVAEMLELQNYARTLMASKKGNPSVTDGLTGSSLFPLFTPANEVVPGEEAPPELRPFTPVVPTSRSNGDHS